MPALRDILKKKDRIHETQGNEHAQPIPDITFLRTTTNLQEQIEPVDFPGDSVQATPQKTARHFSRPFAARAPSPVQDPNQRRSFDDRLHSAQADGERPKKLSLFHRKGRSRSKSEASSAYLPENLGDAPPIPSISVTGSVDKEEQTAQEARWEKRATVLASSSSLLDSESHSRSSRDRSPSISDAEGDIDIQEAIRLHESGDLYTSTRMFGRLANPNGANNALSQVLYGLALRHGWGIDIDPQKAVHYLSLAAANSANVEQQALAAGVKKGGAAKGELVLAIFELANCLRNGWGVNRDPVAARSYYETAANLGDTDAMNEAAWCYLEGFGGVKDKFKAAQYLRLAEAQGAKAVGNSWIWKEKYNPK